MDVAFKSFLESINDQSAVAEAVKKFAIEQKSTADLSQVPFETKTQILNKLLSTVSSSESNELSAQILSIILIFTRDSTLLSALCTDEFIIAFLKLAEISEQLANEENTVKPNCARNLNAIKCLCNLVFQSQSDKTVIEKLQSHDFEAALCNHIVIRWKFLNLDLELLHFESVLLFLYTAIVSNSRKTFINYPDIQGSYLFSINRIIDSLKNGNSTDSDLSIHPTKVLANMMKCMYTLLANTSFDEACQRFYTGVANHCRTIFLIANSPENYEELLTHTFTVVGTLHRVELGSLVPVDDSPGNFQGFSTQLLERVYLYLRPMRKYLRACILPPRKDVHTLPQEGELAKNKLVRLMTNNKSSLKVCLDKEVTELVSEFMFILCKENVGRLLKYTGYGNAAGMMFTRGLGLKSPAPADYSDDEDTDTEEFAENHEGFNYVTGRVEKPKPDPFAGMSEERKEYETEQLLNTLARLEKLDAGSGLQPMTMDEQGRPVPILDSLRAAAANRSSTPPSSDDDEH